ncbi:hypothetical protein MCOR25_005535 [Pyricularia grisea]|uniref:SWIM-type domain-containing protein n=1 Tax=Pyricularia grisea TaxID=148305 RepID=A0A6P8AVC7_PYRGI|nr:uncharacterized protein PgNI_08182 [Pyricularia grisea]KAI6364938.1 hypothetical protein MCOR25_005535 [Pyricularia grisea]TLD06178.1 hypothetical protein PgNI_08182 [Pyricularia grisea]
MTTKLPSPRQVLTSLITSISLIPPPTDTQLPQRQPTTAQTQQQNILSQLDPAHRPLLTALHALFPALLLPALDLLDRGLVSRIELVDDRDKPAKSPGPAAQKPTTGTELQQDQPPPTPSPAAAAAASIYHVRSAQPQPRHHRSRTAEQQRQTQKTYVVHLAAWNCTCAAFAFSAFPGDGGGGGGGAVDSASSSSTATESPLPPPSTTQPRELDFGGLSLDGTRGREAQGVPCCKHLLACLLADRWDGVLGRYVVVRRVGREEMAGVLAEG